MLPPFKRHFQVTVETDARSGRIVLEDWRLDGKQHRDGDLPAEQTWSGWNGNRHQVLYYRDGDFHRENGPAYITYDPTTDKLSSEIWFIEGRIHRDGDLPADLRYSETTDVILHEIYWKNGQEERANGPAAIYRSEDTGRIVREDYFRNGQLHRDDGPAQIYYDEDTGAVVEQSYYSRGQLIRTESAVPASSFSPPPSLAPG